MPGTPLQGTIEQVERSIFHAVRREVVDKGFIPDVLETVDIPIVAIIAGAGGTFTIGPGDFTTDYAAGRIFEVTGDPGGNDGFFTIASSTFSGPDTDVVIIGTESIPSAVVAGQTEVRKYFNDTAGIALFKGDFAAIKAALGFGIEIFGVGGLQSRNLKRIPRIVVVDNRKLPGALGGAPDRVYKGIGPDPLNPDSFDASILPPQTTEFQYDIHIISNQSRQSRAMHEIVALALPKRGYIDHYLDATQKLFVYQYSYRDIPNAKKGIDEKIYLYEVQDIFETDNKPVATGIKPITEITVEQFLGEPDEFGGEGNAEQTDSFIVN